MIPDFYARKDSTYNIFTGSTKRMLNLALPKSYLNFNRMGYNLGGIIKAICEEYVQHSSLRFSFNVMEVQDWCLY